MICQPCDGMGFKNLYQLDDDLLRLLDDLGAEAFLSGGHVPDDSDVCVCDCCGNGEDAWHGEPGHHYGADDRPGPDGPYAYNGGLCKCH